jgi:hypothetical protein
MHTPTLYRIPVSAPVRHFVRHYVEMVAAMLLGMGVLGLALAATGARLADAPALGLLAMATAMTVPMVAWMRHRGHGPRPCAEMAAAMFVPTFVAIPVEAAGLAGFHTVMAVEHVAMFAAMALAMALRPAEYTRHHAPASS